MRITEVEERIKRIEMGEALAILFSRAGFGKKEMIPIYEYKEARSIAADFVLWLREPTKTEHQVVTASLFGEQDDGGLREIKWFIPDVEDDPSRSRYNAMD